MSLRKRNGNQYRRQHRSDVNNVMPTRYGGARWRVVTINYCVSRGVMAMLNINRLNDIQCWR